MERARNGGVRGVLCFFRREGAAATDPCAARSEFLPLALLLKKLVAPRNDATTRIAEIQVVKCACDRQCCLSIQPQSARHTHQTTSMRSAASCRAAQRASPAAVAAASQVRASAAAARRCCSTLRRRGATSSVVVRAAASGEDKVRRRACWSTRRSDAAWGDAAREPMRSCSRDPRVVLCGSSTTDDENTHRIHHHHRRLSPKQNTGPAARLRALHRRAAAAARRRHGAEGRRPRRHLRRRHHAGRQRRQDRRVHGGASSSFGRGDGQEGRVAVWARRQCNVTTRAAFPSVSAQRHQRHAPPLHTKTHHPTPRRRATSSSRAAA